jgi:hypothetical protein
MDELVQWLRDTLDQDKARISAPVFCGGPWPSSEQMLAVIKAHRSIVDGYDELRANPARYTDPLLNSHHQLLRRVVLTLAKAYADRPGYRQEWRP